MFFQDEAASVYSHGTLPLPTRIKFRVCELSVTHVGSKRAKQAMQVATVDEARLEKHGPSAPRPASSVCSPRSHAVRDTWLGWHGDGVTGTRSVGYFESHPWQ